MQPRILQAVHVRGRLTIDQIDEGLQQALYTHDLPDPDLFDSQPAAKLESATFCYGNWPIRNSTSPRLSGGFPSTRNVGRAD